jgi:hypothetical protein
MANDGPMQTILDPSVHEWMDHQYVTASLLKSYYHFSCQLEIWKSFHEGHLSRNGYAPSPLSKAHISRGQAWERIVVKRLKENNLILSFSRNKSLQSQIEGDPRAHFYVVNSAFKEKNLFKKEFIDRGSKPIAFGWIKPDFIEIWKRFDGGKPVIEYHVIDVKASLSVQVDLFSFD